MSSSKRNIKLIWDFRGPYSLKTAEHHVIHLKEYATAENVPVLDTGIESVNEMHTIAYMVVPESVMNRTRDDLKPHRGQVAQ